MAQNADPYRVESVDRAMQLLDLLTERGALSVTEAAAELSVAASTAHRLLTTMTHRGFVEQGEKRLYHPGSKLTGQRADGNQLRQIVRTMRPHVESLAHRLNETVHLLILTGPDVRFLDGVEGTQWLRVGLRIGSRTPAFATSGGKAILADLGDASIPALYPTGLPRWRDQQPAPLDALRRELAHVRGRGYAVNFGESEPNVVAIGVCIGREPSLALSVAIPKERYDENVEKALARELLATAASIRSH
ncbi:IclR family transcriptional regulator [Paramicrobacterium agarici]|uniref:IclR family transcriptional regulator n=1 Tax=Paramicrobacterium agarici TaxID=630514 RepID=UPI00114F0883|nr:IclR family transcriptional regulator [Microbacterium agarici]TQO21385.1 IclR family transcriptional regulator [Microbacterium agarici]